MDAGMAQKSLVGVVWFRAQPAIRVRAAHPAARSGADSTPLVGETVRSRDESRDVEQPQRTARDVIIDPETSKVVFRVRDALTGQVLQQVPDRAALRLQAYARNKIVRALAEGKNPFSIAQAATHGFDALT